MGVNFCRTTIGEVIEQFPDAEYYVDFEFLAVTGSGETLGARYDELFFLVRPDDIIVGLHVLVKSGDLGEIERNLDLLAEKRWSKNVRKISNEKHIIWAPSTANIARDSDVHMWLLTEEITPLAVTRQTKHPQKSIIISLSSNTACDRAAYERSKSH